MRKMTMLGMIVGLVVVGFGLVAAGTAAEVCLEEGKVESQVDGDLDDIVLEEGTLVCIKAGNDMVTVEADGESTLAELIDNGHNVSHYTVLEETTTTTTLVEETTTTQSDEEPTTTLVDETTTTAGDTTTTVDETTTTQGSTTSTGATTTTTDPGEAPEELPFTGISATLLWGIGVALISTGMFLVRRFQGR